MKISRSELAMTRLLTVATVMLLIGMTVWSVTWLIDDWNDLTDRREAASASTDDQLDDRLVELDASVRRSLAAVSGAGEALAVDIAQSDKTLSTALSEAVISENPAGIVKSLRFVLLQDHLAEWQIVDENGAAVDSEVPWGYNPATALDRADDSVFLTTSNVGPVDDGVVAYFPSGSQDRLSWVGLVLDSSLISPPATMRDTLGTNEGGSSIDPDGEIALLRVTVPFGSTSLRLQERIQSVDVPPSRLPFVAKASAAVLAIASLATLGWFARRLAVDAAHRQRRMADLGEGSIAFEQNIIGVAELDSRGVIVDANQAFCDQVDLPRTQVIGTSLLSLTAVSDRSRHLGQLDRVISGAAASAQVEHRLDGPKSDTEVWVLEHLSRRETRDGPRILVQSQDITFQRYATWELAKQALHDELTGLPNRAMLVHRLRSALNQAAEAPEDQEALVGVMFIDVDRFKMVNDSLGHDVGDRLIQHVASRIQRAVRVNDTVSRFGGDEFVVLCDELDGLGEAAAIAQRIREAVADPFVEGGATVHQTLSIGIATSRRGSMAADELLQGADAAMYRAKERGRNRTEVFDSGMRDLAIEQVALEAELREAIDAEQIAMYFQPIVDASSYAVAGFEALIRWPHRKRGLLAPGQFLSIAENAGLQGRLDSLALKKTCRQMALWTTKYPLASNLYVSANKVPQNFREFVQTIREVVASTGLPPRFLMVEVVENALIDNADGAIRAIEELKEMGVRVAIDDFGTGYSSLSYLTQFKPTTLKIDRAFVSKLPDDEATASVVQAITEMALALQINVIAEGVETWEQAEVLNRMGVPYFQGYLFAKPRPVSEIEAWFEANSENTTNADLPVPATTSI